MQYLWVKINVCGTCLLSAKTTNIYTLEIYLLYGVSLLMGDREFCAVNIQLAIRAKPKAGIKVAVLQWAEFLYCTFVVISYSSVHSTASFSGESRGTGDSVQVSVSSRGSDSYLWLDSKQYLSRSRYRNCVRVRPPSSPGGPATLTLLATPQHNNNVVLCRATIRIGFDVLGSNISPTATLTVHGELVTTRFVKHFTVATDITNVLLLQTPSPWYGMLYSSLSTVWTSLGQFWTQLKQLFLILCVDWLMSTSSRTPTPSVCVTDSPSSWLLLMERWGEQPVDQILDFLRGQKVCMVHYILYMLLVTLLHCAGSTEEPHRIRESGENKSVGFKATVSNFIFGEIYTCTHAY